MAGLCRRCAGDPHLHDRAHGHGGALGDHALTVTFAAEVDLPAASFVNEYAQVSNTAYYYLPGETLMMMRPSNTVTRTIYDKAAFEIFLPLVLREG